MSVKSQYLLNISARHQMNSRYKITGLQVATFPLLTTGTLVQGDFSTALEMTGMGEI